MTGQTQCKSFHRIEKGNESNEILKDNQLHDSHPLESHLMISKSSRETIHPCERENEEIKLNNDFTEFANRNKKTNQMVPVKNLKIMDLYNFPMNQIKVKDLSIKKNLRKTQKRKVIESKSNIDKINHINHNVQKREDDLSMSYLLQTFTNITDTNNIMSKLCYAPTHQFKLKSLSVDGKEKNYKKRKLEHHYNLSNSIMLKADIKKHTQKLNCNSEHKKISTKHHHNQDANNETVTSILEINKTKINTSSVSKNDWTHTSLEHNTFWNDNPIFFVQKQNYTILNMPSKFIISNSFNDNETGGEISAIINKLVLNNTLNLQDSYYHQLLQSIQTKTNTNEKIGTNKFELKRSGNVYSQFGKVSKMPTMFEWTKKDTSKKYGRFDTIYFTADSLKRSHGSKNNIEFIIPNGSWKCKKEVYESCNDFFDSATEKNMTSKHVKLEVILGNKRSLSCSLDVYNSNKRRKRQKWRTGFTTFDSTHNDLSAKFLSVNLIESVDIKLNSVEKREIHKNLFQSHTSLLGYDTALSAKESKQCIIASEKQPATKLNSNIFLGAKLEEIRLPEFMKNEKFYTKIVSSHPISHRNLISDRALIQYNLTEANGGELKETLGNNRLSNIKVAKTQTEKVSMNYESYLTAIELKKFLIDQNGLSEMRILVGNKKYSYIFSTTIGKTLQTLKWNIVRQCYIEPVTELKFFSKLTLIEFIFTRENWKNKTEIHKSCNQFIKLIHIRYEARRCISHEKPLTTKQNSNTSLIAKLEEISKNSVSFHQRTSENLIAERPPIEDNFAEANEEELKETLENRINFYKSSHEIDKRNCQNNELPNIKDAKTQTEKVSMNYESYLTDIELKKFLIDQNGLLEILELAGPKKYSSIFSTTIGKTLQTLGWKNIGRNYYMEPVNKIRFKSKLTLIEFILTSENWKNRTDIHKSCNQFIKLIYMSDKTSTNNNSNEIARNKSRKITVCQTKQKKVMMKSQKPSTIAELKQYYIKSLKNELPLKRKKVHFLFSTLIWERLRKLKWTQREMIRTDNNRKRIIYQDPVRKKQFYCMKAVIHWILTDDDWKNRKKIQEICNNFCFAILEDDKYKSSLWIQNSMQQEKMSRKNEARKGNRMISKRSNSAKVERMRRFKHRNYIVKLEVRPSQKFENRNGLFVSFDSSYKVLIAPSGGIDLCKYDPFAECDRISLVVLEAKQFLFREKINEIPIWEKNGTVIDFTDENCIVHEEANESLLLEINKTNKLTSSNVDIIFNDKNELHYILREKFRINRGESKELIIHSKRKQQNLSTIPSFYNFIKRMQTMDEETILEVLAYFTNHTPENSEARFRMHWATKQINQFCSKILYGCKRKKTPEYLQLKINNTLNKFPRMNHVEDEKIVTKNEYVGCCVKTLSDSGYKIGMVEEVIMCQNKKEKIYWDKYKIYFNDKQLGFQEWDEETVEKNIFPVPFGNWMLM